MLSFPKEVLSHIYGQEVTPRSPAYFVLDDSGRLVDWDGALAVYGIQDLKKGVLFTDVFDFLEK